MKENKWKAPVLPKSWALQNATITGIAETETYAWGVGKEGKLGYTKDCLSFTDITTGTREDFWCCTYDERTGLLLIGATTGVYYFDAKNKTGLRKFTDGIDVKDMLLKKDAAGVGWLYFVGYEGGLYRTNDNFQKPTELISPKQAPAARSICTNLEDPHNPIYIGLKSGAVWAWCDDWEKPARFDSFGVPGNGVMLTNGTDILAAHRDIKYNGSKIFTVPPNEKGKTANVCCGYWNGDRVMLFGEDALEIEVDCETLTAEVIRSYEKGLFLSVLQSGKMEIAVGSGIKDGNGVISPIVYRETEAPAPKPNPKPGEVDLVKLAEFSNGLANATADLGKAVSNMNLKITQFYDWVKEASK